MKSKLESGDTPTSRVWLCEDPHSSVVGAVNIHVLWTLGGRLPVPCIKFQLVFCSAPYPPKHFWNYNEGGRGLFCFLIGSKAEHMLQVPLSPLSRFNFTLSAVLPCKWKWAYLQQWSQNVGAAAPTIDPTSSWLLLRSTAIGWLNKEDTMSSRHLWWGPPAPTFWDHWSAGAEEPTLHRKRKTTMTHAPSSASFLTKYLAELYFVFYEVRP